MSDDIDFEFESEKLLRGLEDKLRQVEQEFSLEKEQFEDIERQEKELYEKLRELAKQKRQFEGTVFDYRKKIRRIKNVEIPQQEQQVKIDKQNKLQAAEQEKLKAKFDEITDTVEWRKHIMPHQLDGAHFMASAERCIVADAMGTGKTIETIAALDMAQAQRVLVICPGDVMQSFRNEFKKWAPHRRVKVVGRQPKMYQESTLELFRETLDQFAIIINYETWYRNKRIWDWVLDCQFDTVIIDEAHAIKEVTGLPYKGVYKIVMTPNMCSTCQKPLVLDENRGTRDCPNCLFGSKYESSVKRFYALTGTPILNKPSEIYPLLHIAQPSIFQTQADFRRKFTRTDAENKEIWTIDGQSNLAKQISGMYIRRTLKDTGIKLPPQDIIEHEVIIDPVQHELQYDFLKKLFSDALVQIEDGRAATVTSILALITRQRQGTVWPGGVWMNVPRIDEEGNIIYEQVDREDGTVGLEMVCDRVHVGKDYQQSAKLDKAIDLYNELVDGGHRVIFFSQFKEALKEVKRRIGDELAEFHGDVPSDKREEVKRNFDLSFGEEPKWKGIAAHYGVGGVGVTFTAATAIIILDEEWNMEKSRQAYDRIHRIGQTKETQVHILRHVVNEETPADENGKRIPSIDDWMTGLRDRKEGIVSGFNVSIDELKKAFKEGGI